MKRIILLLIFSLFLVSEVYADNEEMNIDDKVFYFSNSNYYYIRDINSDKGFIDGDISLYETIANEKDILEIFNVFFPEDSCTYNCGINKKELLFEAVLKYNYNKNSELESEINIAKIRYTNQEELDNDLNEIEEKVSILIENKDSYKDFWSIESYENKGIDICGTKVETGIISYDVKKRFHTNNIDIFNYKHYLVSLPLSINTGYELDSMSMNNFDGKSTIYEINSLTDLESLSSVSFVDEVILEKVNEDFFTFDFNYVNIKEKLEKKLSEVYETYNNQDLIVSNMKILLFYENDDGKLVYVSGFNPSYYSKQKSFTNNCKSIYTINNEEAFNMEVYNGGVNSSIADKNNKLFLKRIDIIFQRLDRKYDFWNLESKINKKNYYIVLTNIKEKLENYRNKMYEKIIFYSNQDFQYISDNKLKIEKFFEKKMFIDYLIKKCNFRIEEGLIKYYELK